MQRFQTEKMKRRPRRAEDVSTAEFAMPLCCCTCVITCLIVNALGFLIMFIPFDMPVSHVWAIVIQGSVVISILAGCTVGILIMCKVIPLFDKGFYCE